MQIADLVPRDEPEYGAEQLFIAGQKGRGKSRLEDKIIRAIPPTVDKKGKRHGWCVVIIDSKLDWEFSRVPWSRQFYKVLPTTDLRLVPDGHYVYRPKVYPEKADPGARRIFRTALRRKYCVVVIDEGGDFGGGSVIPELGKLFRQSRSKHVIVIFGCQRPTSVDLLAISESTRLICFILGWERDYERMEKNGYPEFANPPDGEHDFNFYNRRTRQYVRVQQTQGK